MIDYEYLIQKSMLSVVKDALNLIAISGPESGCNILITFITSHHKVKLSNRVKEQYPQKMMIVLQHSFWGLKADEDGIYVSLSFSSIPENIFIPYEALISYYDKTSEFGLQFAEEPNMANDDKDNIQLLSNELEDGIVDEKSMIVPDEKLGAKDLNNSNLDNKTKSAEGHSENEFSKDEKLDEHSDIVVSLDKFRKK